MILLIDNYDSFTYNIFHYFADLKQEVVVKRNDEVTISQIKTMCPNYIVIGPGPCTPKQAGISEDVIKTFITSIPLLGICLGHQSIATAFGAKIKQANTLMHGKNCDVYHNEQGIFESLPNPISCTRYNSLVIDKATLPPYLEVTAWTLDDDIMGIKHKDYPTQGVQFHPDAFLTQSGHKIFANFLKN